MNHDNLLLENQLCFALYSASNAVIRAYRGQLAELNLTYPQYLVMLALWDLEQCGVRDLAEALKIDSATLTPILKRMEAAGLVTRQRDDRDERRLQVKLTAKAVEMREKLAPIQDNVACSTGLDRKEFAYLKDRLHELARDIEARYPRQNHRSGDA